MENLALTAFVGGFGGAWFAMFMLFFIVVGVIANEMDSFWMGVGTLLVGLAAMEWLFQIPVWASIAANPLMLVLYAAVYLAVGSLYTGVWSWPNYIKDRADHIKMDYGSFLNKRKLKGDADSFEEFLDSSEYRYTASKNKDRLAAWVLMWPFGLIWDLSHRPARWLWNNVYAVLGTTFERVSKNTARKIHGGS